MITEYFLSLSDLFQRAWYSLGLSTLLQMVKFHSFLWPSNMAKCVYIYIYIYIETHTYIYLISSSIYLLMNTEVAFISWLL